MVQSNEPRAEPADELSQLAAAARAPARFRLGVGAAVVLLLLALVAAVIVSAVSQQARVSTVAAPSDAPSSPGTSIDSQGAVIFVHVLGAVPRPGLFELRDGARVIDAIAAAGGMTDMADPAGVNLARRVSDGEQLYVPQAGEAPPGAPPGAATGAAGRGETAVAKVNLNTATAADLETLPRIGPALAARILDYREANGRFGTVEDLRNVTGIGEKTFAGLKDLITT